MLDIKLIKYHCNLFFRNIKLSLDHKYFNFHVTIKKHFRTEGYKPKNELIKDITSKHSGKHYKKNLRDERSHMESLLNQRFNFFIIIFGLIVAAIPSVHKLEQLKLILILGFVIEFIFTLLIGRAQRRLGINMELLDASKKDPSTDIKLIANQGCLFNPFRFSVVKFIGYVLPILITLALFISIVYSREIFIFFKTSSTDPSFKNIINF